MTLADKTPTSHPTRRNRLMKLEQRMLFDAALAVGALDAASKAAPDSGQSAPQPDPLVAGERLSDAQQHAKQAVVDTLAGPDGQQLLVKLFSPNQTGTPTQQWQKDAEALLGDIKANNFNVRVELRSATEMGGVLGAFAASGPDGNPVIYLNADWAQSGITAQALHQVLVEEMGHAIDQRLNGNNDTAGDEGQAFAGQVVYGDANLSATRTIDDHVKVTINGQTIDAEAAAPFGIAQIHFVPLPEPDVQTALTAIAGVGKVSGDIKTVIAISATSDNTVVVYDQWEDGYEADLSNPLQSSTQIWGDGNLANGVAPGTADDIIHAGQTLLLQNAVNPASPLTPDYDGRDKIGSTRAISVTKAGWSTVPGTVLAGAISVVDAGNAGLDYIIPIGENVDTVATGTNRLFEYTSAHIIATADNTVVTIDLQGDGNAETTITLNQGQTYMVNGGIKAGAHITATKGVGVYVIAGDVGSAYENRWFSITPREQWANSYYAPVGTTLAADPAYVILYNPNSVAIDVYYDTATSTGKISVPANVANGAAGTNYMLMPASAAHFYTKDNSKFYAVGVIDADATSNATHDWSYSLVPETYLTTKFVVGWGPGYDLSAASSTNASPVWVTATDDTSIFINSTTVTVKDSKGNVIVGDTVNGITEYAVKALESYRLFDADKDQSGLTVYTEDGTLITAAWGEDPSIAGAGAPYLDMGTTVLPFPDYVFTKNSTEASRVTYGSVASDGDGQVELNEQIEYTISLTNRAVIDLYNINIKDAINPADSATYIAGSTTMKIVRADGTVLYDGAIADDALNDPFPLAKLDGGYTIADIDPNTPAIDGLKRGDQVIVKYRVRVRPDVNAALAAAGFQITNDAEMTGAPAGTGTNIPAKTTTNQTIVSVNGTGDGLVSLKDAAFSGATAVYQEGATLGIEVTDSDPNTRATAVDTLTVTVTNATSGEIELVTLTETGINTGIFRNTLATSISTGGANNDHTLHMARGDNIRVDYTDPIFGGAFDNPGNPGVSGDADNNIATGNANTAFASIPVPSQTKILYLSDDSANNLDRVLPPAGDATTALTPTINASSGAVVVTISDAFTTNNYTGGSGWVGNWTELGDDNSTTGGGIRIGSSALYFRGGVNNDSISRGFTALAAGSTLTFDIRDSSTANVYEAADKFYIYEQVGGSWSLVNNGKIAGVDLATGGTIVGSSLTTTAKTVSIQLSAGATGIRFQDDNGNTSSDRVYVDNIKIVSGSISTGNTAGATDFPISSASAVGQTFSFSGAGATADAISVDSLTLSLKKTGTTAATATVTIRSAWGGDALWTGTVSTASLSTSYSDVAIAVTGLTLDRNATYVIQVTSANSGIVWQGDTAGSYATGTRLNASGVASAGDMRFALSGKESVLSSVTFTQSQTMATDFTLPAGGVIKVVTYTANETGLTNGTVSGITATLSSNGSSFASSASPVYDSATHTLTWTFNALGSAKTIAAGQGVKLQINNTATGKSFQIAYDSETTRSRIELPTTTVISIADADPVTSGVQEVGLFNNSLANGGTPITSGFIDAGGVVYVRVKVADPFGDYDISSLALNIDDGAGGATPIVLSLNDAYVVDAAGDGRAYKTYEYAWQTTFDPGSYSIRVVANEGSEGTVTDSAGTNFQVTATDLGTPSTTLFLTGLTATGGTDAGAVYATGASAFVRITDLDKSAASQVTAVINGYTVTLAVTSTAGIFEADLSNAAVHGGNAAAAAYFTNMAGGTSLSATYVDANDSSDSSTDTIVVNSAPIAVDNNKTVAIDKQATGNAITDDDNGPTAGGLDTDADGQRLTLTAVNGVAASVNDTITLASGARLFVGADGSYLYDPSSLTIPPTSGSPVADSFTYTVSDGKGGTATATVNFTVTYVNPIVISNQSDSDGALVEYDISAKFADLPSPNQDFSASGLPAGLTIDPATGIISGTVDAAASTSAGTSSYTVNITAADADGINPDVTRTFTWTVNNVAPVAANDFASTAEGSTLTGNVLTNDNDGAPDSDVLSVTTFTVNGITYAAGATPRAIAGVGTIAITSTGAYTFVGDAAFHGGSVPAITYTLSDGSVGGTATGVLNLSVIGVNDITVNEASPVAVFEVSGVPHEMVSLSLANGTALIDANGTPLQDGSEDFGPTIQTSADNGSTWVTYTSGTVALSSSGKLLVRTQVINDTADEGNQTFSLRATNALGAFDAGVGTINDRGLGNIFKADGTNDAAAVRDDDRTLAVNSITVNEASPYAVFTVTGVSGQQLRLAQGNTASSADVDAALGTDTANAGTGVPLQYFDGSTWLDYTPGSVVSIPVGGAQLLVRTAIANDANFEGTETFTLVASNTGGTSATGIASIKDDGTGTKYTGTVTGTTPDTSIGNLDDDRALAVNSIAVNEASPYAVFTVTGLPGQTMTLALGNTADGADVDATLGTDTGNAGTGVALQIFDGSTWQDYAPGSVVSIPGGGTQLLVRTAVTNDANFEGTETFTLVVTEQSGRSTSGIASIKDDGTGTKYTGAVTGTTPDTSTGNLDDDRPLTINNITVNEASPYAVFTVQGAAGQAVALRVTGVNAGAAGVDFGSNTASNLEYSLDGGRTWLAYSTAPNPVLVSNTLLVRTPITNDSAPDNGETFQLTAIAPSGAQSIATAVINDAGGGTVFNGDGSVNAMAVKDDDRFSSTPAAPPLYIPLMRSEPVLPAMVPAMDISAFVLAAVSDARQQKTDVDTQHSDSAFNTATLVDLDAVGATLGRDDSLHVLPSVADVASDVAANRRTISQAQARIQTGDFAFGLFGQPPLVRSQALQPNADAGASNGLDPLRPAASDLAPADPAAADAPAAEPQLTPDFTVAPTGTGTDLAASLQLQRRVNLPFSAQIRAAAQNRELRTHAA